MSQDFTVDDALADLVQQFADPFACLRELIQNSLDAGSPQVDVNVLWADGVVTLEVQDYGGGMDRQIIEQRLTRLFSSGKDGDLTKIGRFGIGFVSVFALQPDAVVVDTGRLGESWRVLFKRDRSFVRLALDEPLDGTCVRIMKALPEAELPALRARAREAVVKWCRFVDAEITVDGERIDRAFELADAPLQVCGQVGEQDVRVGYGEPWAGFYNKGLTLYEGPPDDSAPAQVRFAISGRNLEHTLTRDAVVHDAAWAQGMAEVKRLAAGPLVARWVQALRDREPAAFELLAGWPKGLSLPDAVRDAPAFTLAGGERRAVAKVQGKAVLRSTRADGLARVMAADGETVYVVEAPAQASALARWAEKATDVADGWLYRGDPPAAASYSALARAVEALLGARGAKLAAVHPVAYESPRDTARLPVIAAPAGATWAARSGATLLGQGFFDRRRDVWINVGHPAVQALLAVAEQAPEFAAYGLVKLFELDRDDARLATDLALFEAATKG
ncbi:MAG: ATP-binding protein [Myxococcales bacterium]|nr:ATP-binding protein [Myxococcales bacterium]